MKIGIVTNLYPPYARGGAEQVVVRTVEALTEMNQEVFVITACRLNKKLDKIGKDTRATERIYRFFPRNFYFLLDDYKFPKILRLFWHIIDAFSTYGRNVVAGILSDELPDIVMTHNLKGIGLRIPQAMRRMNIPHVHIVHDLQLIYPSGLLFAGKEKEFIMKPFYEVYRFICRLLIKSPDTVIFPSEYLRNEYLKRGFFPESEILVMPNPAPRFAAVKREGRLQGGIRLLFVGQLEPHKGILFLLDALKQFSGDYQLIIAGEGTCSKKIKKAASEDKRITYLGFISMEQLVNCFGVVDALIVPSLCYENSPTVIYESFNAGIPVLASDIGGVGELVQNGKNGYLFKPCSEKDFLAKLQMMDQEKERFAKEQDQIQKTVEEYALESYSKRLVTLLKGIVESK